MMKRSFDIFCSLTALIILSPLLLLIAFILKITGEGEVFYLQERVGRYGVPFRIVKFATMLKESPNLLGGDVTIMDDPRVLPIGKILRKTKINELPQLWNILVGDMSIIGPRPLTPRVYSPFPDSYKDATYSLRPGLSGIGSVVFRDEERLLGGAVCREQDYIDNIIPYKSALEEWYARNISISLDIKLILITLLVIVRPNIDPTLYFKDLPISHAPLRNL